MSDDLRQCRQCKEAHPTSFFNKDSRRPDGIYPNCKNCSRASSKRSYRRYETRYRAEHKKWKAKNRPHSSPASVAWRAVNKARLNAHAANRRARKLGAMPKWVNLHTIIFTYEICPPGYHVDHIHPLQHKDFCGLHVPHNLQFLTAFDNFSKNNRVDPAQLRTA